ncbi:SymE family type I addiction module toxin, partial [Niastella koreensis]
KVWFSYPKRLIGREAEDMEDAVGYTEFGSLLEMDACGWIENYNSPDLGEPVQMAPCKTKDKTVIKKTVPRIRTSKKEPDVYVDYKMDGAGDRSIKRAKKLFTRMKDTLADVAHVSQYMSDYDNKCIRTLKISELSYFNSHSINKPAPYIRISGRWLEKAGFNMGDCIQVVAIKNMMLIVPVPPPFNPYEWEEK